MRILHTSDWHLGRSFHREGMLGHQAAYVDHLLEVVEHEAVDLVVVAGDVYDRALPHVDAVRLADETLARLAASRAQVVLTSGNHDSAQRLGFSSRLIDAAGVFIRTDASGVGTPVLLEDEYGSVAVYGIPYLDPDAVREPWGLPVRSLETKDGPIVVTTVFDLLMAQYGVGRGLPGDYPTSYDDDVPFTPASKPCARWSVVEMPGLTLTTATLPPPDPISSTSALAACVPPATLSDEICETAMSAWSSVVSTRTILAPPVDSCWIGANSALESVGAIRTASGLLAATALTIGV